VSAITPFNHISALNCDYCNQRATYAVAGTLLICGPCYYQTRERYGLNCGRELTPAKIREILADCKHNAVELQPFKAAEMLEDEALDKKAAMIIFKALQITRPDLETLD